MTAVFSRYFLNSISWGFIMSNTEADYSIKLCVAKIKKHGVTHAILAR